MSVTKELIEQEAQLLAGGERMVVHLHKEGTFLRATAGTATSTCLIERQLLVFYAELVELEQRLQPQLQYGQRQLERKPQQPSHGAPCALALTPL